MRLEREYQVNYRKVIIVIPQLFQITLSMAFPFMKADLTVFTGEHYVSSKTLLYKVCLPLPTLPYQWHWHDQFAF